MNDDPNAWLPFVNTLTIVTLLLGLIGLASRLRGWIRKIVHEEVSQPLGSIENKISDDQRDLKDVKRDVNQLSEDLKRHRRRTHERIDQLRDRLNKGQTHG